MKPIFFDTETCGLHGACMLIQYAIGDDEVQLFCPWNRPINETLELIEMIVNHKGGVVGFNLTFDWFHICKLYTTFKLAAERYGYDIYPDDYVNEIALLEDEARDGVCLKPQKALDLMLHARKTEFQCMMDRGDIRIRRIPTALARPLASELDHRIDLPDVYFARSSDPKKRWRVTDIKDSFDEVIPEFKDIVLKFMPSSSLKALAYHALGKKDVIKYSDVEPDPKMRPLETGWAPFATAPVYVKHKSGKKYIQHPSEKDWKWKWPTPVIFNHYLEHWGYNEHARQYAADDVTNTRDLFYYFEEPEMDDDDSVLACMVGAVRWKGFKIDVEKIIKLKDKCVAELKKAKVAFNSAAACKAYMSEVLSDEEMITMTVNGKTTTKSVILEEIVKWRDSDVCEECEGMGCDSCDGDGLVSLEKPHPAAIRAREILDARHAKKEIENYDKLLMAGRFHASFKVIGALSSRMSGSDGLNAQGIKRSTEVRQCFPLAWDDQALCGGDFAGFEVCLADAVYADPKLHELLTTYHDCPKCEGTGCKDCDNSGKTTYKIHGIFGTYLFPGMTYMDILKTKGLPNEQDKYSRSKNGVFAMLYFGEAYTLANRVGIDEAVADEAYARFSDDFPVLAEGRVAIKEMFQSMRQPGGIGTKVEWHEPDEYIESIFGFRRYFTLENNICKVLFELAESPPKEWQAINFKVIRRDREQTACGALRSALFGGAFGLQGSNVRAAGNHRIQSSGAQMTKNLQRKFWDVQPCGVHEFELLTAQVHDEILITCKPELQCVFSSIKDEYIRSHRSEVPLLDIDWGENLKDWSEK